MGPALTDESRIRTFIGEAARAKWSLPTVATRIRDNGASKIAPL